MTTISTRDYLLDQARRRLTTPILSFPGMGLVEKRLLNHEWTKVCIGRTTRGERAETSDR